MLSRDAEYGQGVETQDAHAAAGATIRAGNGAMTLRDGSIIVGRQHIPGVVVRSGEEFGRLFERIEKNVKRKKGVMVRIK